MNGEYYGTRFPILTLDDMVRAQFQLLRPFRDRLPACKRRFEYGRDAELGCRSHVSGSVEEVGDDQQLCAQSSVQYCDEACTETR